MSDLVSWLLEQIADDEIRMKLLHAERHGRQPCDCWPTVERWLAECEAKRAIIDWLTTKQREMDEAFSFEYGGADMDSGVDTHEALRLLALPYAGRTGYREDWRP